MKDNLRRLVRLFPVAAVAVAMFAAAAAPAMARVNGGCSATATDSAGKANPQTIDIGSTDVWHVSKNSQITGKGQAPGDQTHGQASAAAFGIGLFPIASGNGHGTTGEGSIDVSQFADKVRVFAGVGSSDSCSGALTIVIDDVTAFDTLVGKISIALLVIGILIMIAVLVRTRRPEDNVFPASLAGGFGGFLAGLGLYELLVQLGAFDPLSSLGLAFPVAGIIIGLACGIYGGRRVDSLVVATAAPVVPPGTGVPPGPGVPPAAGGPRV
ncbi:MAG: hypothetical protein NVSMB17_14000 [Candidatus Dormibacteria bacterium]